ncbi:MAG: hypothetical protein WEC33_04965 [Dehalococcoidia bacterium]
MPATKICVHHWKVETPSGSPLVAGHCCRCGKDRSFQVVPEAAPESFKVIRLTPSRRRVAS